jgi:hypothetical protein
MRQIMRVDFQQSQAAAAIVNDNSRRKAMAVVKNNVILPVAGLAAQRHDQTVRGDNRAAGQRQIGAISVILLRVQDEGLFVRCAGHRIDGINLVDLPLATWNASYRGSEAPIRGMRLSGFFIGAPLNGYGRGDRLLHRIATGSMARCRQGQKPSRTAGKRQKIKSSFRVHNVPHDESQFRSVETVQIG